MKKSIVLVFIAFSCVQLYCGEITLPPELFWWLHEVKKGNENIELNEFKIVSKDTLPIEKGDVKIPSILNYPVFYRWNYSGNYMAYYDYGCSLGLNRLTGKYSLTFDIDSNLYICRKNGGALFVQPFGSCAGIDGLAWLTDRKLVTAGIEIIHGVNDTATINLIITEYTINEDNIERISYVYSNAFDNKKRSELKLKWYEQRPDYFELDY